MARRQLTEEHKRKIAEAIKQRHMLGLQWKTERCLCGKFKHPGLTCEQIRQKQVKTQLENPNRYWLGKKRDKKTCQAISEAQSKREHAKGKESPCWIGSWTWYHKQARKIVELNLGRKLSRDEIVHHKDMNWENNSIENLQIVSRAEHVRIHKPRLNN